MLQYHKAMQCNSPIYNNVSAQKIDIEVATMNVGPLADPSAICHQQETSTDGPYKKHVQTVIPDHAHESTLATNISTDIDMETI